MYKTQSNNKLKYKIKKLYKCKYDQIDTITDALSEKSDVTSLRDKVRSQTARARARVSGKGAWHI